MTGPWTIRETGLCVAGVLLLASICYYVGKKQGRFEEKLAESTVQIRTNDSASSGITTRVDTAKKNADILTAYRSKVRERVTVVHDTILAPADTSDDIEAIYNPTVARLIAADDSVIAAQKHAQALQDTLISSLRVGITLRDSRIRLLEKEVTPSKMTRLVTATKWIAIGAIAGAAFVHR